MPKTYRFIAFSRTSKSGLRFSNDRDARVKRLTGERDIQFIDLPQPMTTSNAARWLRGQADGYDSALEAAILDTLGDAESLESDLTNQSVDELLPEEVEEPTEIFEGALARVTINAYERNRKARAACIHHYGTACAVCGFESELVYGHEAKDIIHVHHLKPLSSVGGEYEVDPVADLRPVCPNCHAVIHQKGGLRGIEVVQQMIAAARPS